MDTLQATNEWQYPLGLMFKLSDKVLEVLSATITSSLSLAVCQSICLILDEKVQVTFSFSNRGRLLWASSVSIHSNIQKWLNALADRPCTHNTRVLKLAVVTTGHALRTPADLTSYTPHSCAVRALHTLTSQTQPQGRQLNLLLWWLLQHCTAVATVKHKKPQALLSLKLCRASFK